MSVFRYSKSMIYFSGCYIRQNNHKNWILQLIKFSQVRMANFEFVQTKINECSVGYMGSRTETFKVVSTRAHFKSEPKTKNVELCDVNSKLQICRLQSQWHFYNQCWYVFPTLPEIITGQYWTSKCIKKLIKNPN